MSAEILCIGTELLLGNITNGNARWLAEQLAALGLPHHRQTVVGDNRERLMAAVREAAGRCRVLITTGGLGPTPDDLTTEALAAAFNTPLVEHPEIWAEIQARLRAGGRVCSPSNRQQAFWGVSESALAEQMVDLLDGENPTLAPYAGAGEVKLRLTARASSDPEAQALLAPLEAEIRARTGTACYGVDDDTLASVVLEQLRRRGETLAVAESCTAGGLGAALAAVPGASDVFRGGVIAYANAVKQELLGVPAALLDSHGAVSDPVALAMAEGARRVTGASWAIAVTGIAGPGGGTVEKPVGLVHIAVAGPDGSRSEAVRFGSSRRRSWIQTLTAGEALQRLRTRLMVQL